MRYRRPGFDPWVRKIPLEKGMAIHSSILAWRIPGTGEPGRLQTTESKRVRHDCSNLAAAAAAGSSTSLEVTQMCPFYEI